MARKFICTKDYPIAETSDGGLKGYELDGIITFHGIKYADAERFQMPKAIEKWTEVKDATSYGAISPTYGSPIPNGELLIPHRFWPSSEHCQYLNIWTQSLDNSAKKPVLVWFHGGGFADGSSIEQVAYEGDELCRFGDVVVVTVGHRLNILGFLDMSFFNEKYNNSVNAGMGDIVESLKWVKRNIEAFGGDPDNVTIFGQSGGGGKVSTLLQIPEADGLYHKAIMMSGGCDTHDNKSPDHKPLIDEMLKVLGFKSDEYEKLEKSPYGVLMKAYNRAARNINMPLMWGPVPNGWYLGHPFKAGFSDYAKKVPTMASSVISEFGSFGKSSNITFLSSNEEKTSYINDYYSGHGDEILELYKKAYPNKDLLAASKLDFWARPSIIKYLDARTAANPDALAYSYQMALIFDVNEGTPAWHCSDIPFIFHNTCRVGNANIENISDLLEKQMAGSLIAFARTGNPNNPYTPNWKPYTAEENCTMVFDRKTELRNNFDRELLEKAMEYGPEFIGLTPKVAEDDDGDGKSWLY